MGQVHHESATTTATVRRAIQYPWWSSVFLKFIGGLCEAGRWQG